MTRFPASASRAATVPPPAPEPMTRYSQSGGCEGGVDGSMADDEVISQPIAGRPVYRKTLCSPVVAHGAQTKRPSVL